MQEHADLWGVNPQTGRLYTVEERRNMLHTRGVPMSMLGGGQATGQWDRWFDSVADANYDMTGQTPAELDTNFAGGAPAQGSNQIRGVSPGVLALTRFKKGKR